MVRSSWPSASCLPGYTLLHCAAAWGRLETLKVLVALDVDIEALNFREERARDVAARYSQLECVQFLDWAGKEARRCRQLTDPTARFCMWVMLQSKVIKTVWYFEFY